MKIKPIPLEKLHPWLYDPTDEQLIQDLHDRQEAGYIITPHGEQLLLDFKEKT